MRLIGKMQLLCIQCRGIGAHLVARGKSHGFSQVDVPIDLRRVSQGISGLL